MSAIVLHSKHIDALLTFADRPEWGMPARYSYDGETITFYSSLDEIGQKLVVQNVASFNYRYDSDVRPYEYHFTPYPRMLTPVEAIKACDCYMYQACENPGYENTQAWAIIDTIRERAIREIPGMKEAAWVIGD